MSAIGCDFNRSMQHLVSKSIEADVADEEVPKDPELNKVSLVEAKMEVFFDSTVRRPPKTWREFAESRYVEVRFSDTETSLMALPSVNLSKMNPPTISVPNFCLLAPMIKGTDRITTQISAMKYGVLSDLDVAPLPFKSNPINLFLVWHRRENDDPAHKGFRQKIIKTAHSIFDGADVDSPL